MLPLVYVIFYTLKFMVHKKQEPSKKKKLKVLDFINLAGYGFIM